MANQSSPSTADARSALSQLENVLEEYLVKKAPFTLPQNVKEVIVKLAPWLVLIGVVFAIPGILLVLGLGAIVAPFTALGGPQAMVGYGLNYIISMVVLAVSVVLEAVAIPGLFKRSIKAWRLMYYASLIGVVSNLVSFNIIGGLIGAVISFYFLFQVKALYK